MYGLEAVWKLLFGFDVNHTVRGNVHGALGAAGNKEVTHKHQTGQQKTQGNQPHCHRAEEHREQHHEQTQDQGTDSRELQVASGGELRYFRP